jgi:hypothetical protein
LVINKQTLKKSLFTSLKDFVQHNPEYSINTLYNYTSRKKTAFEDDKIILEKIPYFKAKKNL